MPLTTAQQVRTRIADRIRIQEQTFYGDGTASGFKLQQGAPYSTLQSGASAFVSTGGWSGTGSTFDLDMGTVKFSSVIPYLSAFRVEYQWSVFSDDEIAYFTGVGGSVVGASLEAVNALLFDSLKRSRWAAPDGTQYDDTKAQDTLLKMYDILKAQAVEENPVAGGIESWSENQPYWSTPYNG